MHSGENQTRHWSWRTCLLFSKSPIWENFSESDKDRVLTLYNSCMWAETRWTGYRILDRITQICQSLDQGKKIYMTYPRVNIHSLLLNALEAAPTIAGRTRWALDGSNCNLHDCLLKTNENKTWLLHLGFFVAFFPVLPPHSQWTLTPKLTQVPKSSFYVPSHYKYCAYKGIILSHYHFIATPSDTSHPNCV